MSTHRERSDGRWLPAEPLPEPFGVLWGRLWNERRRRCEPKWVALCLSWRDARAVSKLARAKPAPQEAFELGRAFERALPVPVGDETEALRGPGTPHARMYGMWELIHEREAAMADLVGYSPVESGRTSEQAFVQAFDAALARAAGLEARGAALRDALETIKGDVYLYGVGEIDEAKLVLAIAASLNAALADSGEAGS